MLIPSIDLQGGQIVQLVQGERLAVATDDVDGWVRKFERFPTSPVDRSGRREERRRQRALVASICGRLPCRVGGGVRSADRAASLLDGGALKVIVGSSLFRGGQPDLEFAGALAERFGAERLIAAVDAREGQVVIDGWRTRPDDYARRGHSGARAVLRRVPVHQRRRRGADAGHQSRRDRRRAARRRAAITAAGGVTTQEEIDWLDEIGVDAVVGMAIYTGVWRSPG